MQAETWQVHTFGNASAVQHGKDILDLWNVVSTHAVCFVFLEEPFEPLVPEAPNHGSMVGRKATIVNCQPQRRGLAFGCWAYAAVRRANFFRRFLEACQSSY